MNKNFPSRLCREVKSFSLQSHSTARVKPGRATIPTPTKNRESVESPRGVSAVTLCLELCMPGKVNSVVKQRLWCAKEKNIFTFYVISCVKVCDPISSAKTCRKCTFKMRQKMHGKCIATHFNPS